jgi:phage shock protein E
MLIPSPRGQAFTRSIALLVPARRWFIAFALAAGLLAGCAPSGASVEQLAAIGIVDVDVERAAELVAAGDVVILDIRTPGEFTAGHIPGATNVDYRDRDFAERVAALDPSHVYLMHCAVGGRSARALTLFHDHGFSNVHHLRTGFEGWKAAGMEVTR